MFVYVYACTQYVHVYIYTMYMYVSLMYMYSSMYSYTYFRVKCIAVLLVWDRHLQGASRCEPHNNIDVYMYNKRGFDWDWHNASDFSVHESVHIYIHVYR